MLKKNTIKTPNSALQSEDIEAIVFHCMIPKPTLPQRQARQGKRERDNEDASYASFAWFACLRAPAPPTKSIKNTCLHILQNPNKSSQARCCCLFAPLLSLLAEVVFAYEGRDVEGMRASARVRAPLAQRIFHLPSKAFIILPRMTDAEHGYCESASCFSAQST